VLRKIWGHSREEVTADWRKLRNEVLHDLHSPPNSIWAKARREVSWVGHVALTGERREVHTGFWWGNLRERHHFEDLGIDRALIVKWIFNKIG
jgi:hypothetical protein